jgi:hypothetical protein
MKFLDGRPTVNRPSVRHKNRVLREERGDACSIVLVECTVILFNEREIPLAELWIWRLFVGQKSAKQS